MNSNQFMRYIIKKTVRAELIDTLTGKVIGIADNETAIDILQDQLRILTIKELTGIRQEKDWHSDSYPTA